MDIEIFQLFGRYLLLQDIQQTLIIYLDIYITIDHVCGIKMLFMNCFLITLLFNIIFFFMFLKILLTIFNDFVYCLDIHTNRELQH